MNGIGTSLLCLIKVVCGSEPGKQEGSTSRGSL